MPDWSIPAGTLATTSRAIRAMSRCSADATFPSVFPPRIVSACVGVIQPIRTREGRVRPTTPPGRLSGSPLVALTSMGSVSSRLPTVRSVAAKMHCAVTDVKSVFRQRFFAGRLHTMAPTDSIPPFEKPIGQQQPSVVAVEELGRLVRDYRGRQSIRQAAAEAGVSFSTLSRVEAGAQPDLATFLRLCAWLEVPPERFFRDAAQRPTDTLDAVSGHLFADPKLSPDAAERIAHVV